MKYFTNCETLEELKKEYKKLAMANHPDMGGDEETMKVINAEYDKVFAQVKNIHRNKDGETYTKENTETASEFKDIIEKLIKMNGIEIEIIGCFIWVSGDTKPNKDTIKAMGFRWHSDKKMRYKAPEGYRKKNKTKYSIEEIRGMFGTSGKMYGRTEEQVFIGA